MTWAHRGKEIPLEIYHGVPKGWYKTELLEKHRQLGGTFNIGGPEATEPGAPSWMPERNAWLQYRETLYRIADGVLANDLACIELAFRYIEMRHIGSYSGFVRSLLSRRLKHVQLSEQQKQRLHQHFSALVLSGERTELWRLCTTEAQREELLGKVSGSEQAVKWLAEALLPKQRFQPKSLPSGKSPG